MRTKILSIFVILSILILSFNSCTDKGPDIKPTPLHLDLSSASTNNPYATLGRVLFYDTHLSVNNSISCATCHKQSMAFSDNVAFSRGFENSLTKRNALPIQNLFTTSKLFWDGRAQNLNQMVLMPILNHVEMGMNDISAVINKIRNLPYYHDLFVNAFDDSNVDQNRIALCLSQFVRNISAGNSRFDQASSGNTTLTALELHGQDLFFNKYNCSGCHQQSFGSYNSGVSTFVNIGLEMNYADQGLGAISQEPAIVHIGCCESHIFEAWNLKFTNVGRFL